jgi:hypothetical protein
MNGDGKRQEGVNHGIADQKEKSHPSQEKGEKGEEQIGCRDRSFPEEGGTKARLERRKIMMDSCRDYHHFEGG